MSITNWGGKARVFLFKLLKEVMNFLEVAWNECTFYTPEEKVALELSEHITLIHTKRVPEDLYKRVREHYDEKQYVDLVLIINQINSWNRISIAMGNTAIENNYSLTNILWCSLLLAQNNKDACS